MSDSYILFGGVAVFGLMLLGLLLTSYEFKKMSRSRVAVVPALKSRPDFADSRQSNASRAAGNQHR